MTYSADIAGWTPSGVPSIGNEFPCAPISSQGIVNQSFTIFAEPSLPNAAVALSVSADMSQVTGAGPVVVGHFGAVSSGPASLRVNSTFMEERSNHDTQSVALFADAIKYGGSVYQYVFGANISATDRSSGPGCVIGAEIDVYGNAHTGDKALGLGVYAKSETGSGFNGGIAVRLDADPGNSWGVGLTISGLIGYAAIRTFEMGNSQVAMHMGNLHQLAWDGAAAGRQRAWIRFNSAANRFEFFIDGAVVGHIP